MNSCKNESECVDECFLVLFVVFFVFCLFSYVCLCAPIKRPLIGVEGCVREVRTIGEKVGRVQNVVSF